MKTKFFSLIIVSIAIFTSSTTFANICPPSTLGELIAANFYPQTNDPPNGKNVTFCDYFSSDQGTRSSVHQNTKVVPGEGLWRQRDGGPKGYLICEAGGGYIPSSYCPFYPE